MTTILSLPSWFDAAECELTLVPELRTFAGPFGGPTEVQDMLGDRWRMRLQLPDGDFRWGGRTAGLLNALRGGAQWLRVHHLGVPVPRGTARGAITLSSTMAQGAATMVLANVCGLNALIGGSFEVDSNADGMADGWARYSAGSTGALTQALFSTTTEHGAKRQLVTAAALAGTSADRNGLQQVDRNVSHLAGLQVTFGASVAANASTRVVLSLQWKDVGGSVISTATSSDFTPTGGSDQLALTATVPANAETVTAFIWQHSGTGGSHSMHVDIARLVAGASAGTYPSPGQLLAGDMLGHNSEQLFQVYDDATASDAGALTVTTVNRARKAIASGQAIVWNKPAVPFQLITTDGVPTAYLRGRTRGQSIELVEAWQ